MKFDMTKMVEEIVMQVKENQEEFIFETIRPYCENILQMKINKEELKQILLKEMQKQQPCEDCVSRQAVIKHICESKECYKDECKGRLYKRCYDLQWIYALPSVTPSRPKGKWIAHPKGIYAHLVCSKCLSNAPYDCRTNYCPNCGADMRESEE